MIETKIEELMLTDRSYNALRKAGITTVNQLIAIDFDSLHSIKGVGSKSISEICFMCARHFASNINLNFGERSSEIERRERMKKQAREYIKISRMIRDFDVDI